MTDARIFFVTDVHGSERCFRKFLNAAKFYKASVLILGGDITGKLLVPLVAQADGTRKCEYAGQEYTLKSQKEIDEMTKNIRDSGYYPRLMEQTEVDEISSSPEALNRLFRQVMKSGIEDWMRLADERLKGSGVKCYVSPGNDDVFDIDEALNSATFVVNPEEKVVDIDGEHEMITLGYSNHTPWNSPREVDEEVLEEKIERMASQVKNMKTAIFNTHVPPIDTIIDQAPKLDSTLKPVVSGGNMIMTSAGSSAVRRTIERHQPLVGIHGHVHESRGIVRVGKTMCFNPGSEYGTGVLRGLLLELDRDKIKTHMLTSG